MIKHLCIFLAMIFMAAPVRADDFDFDEIAITDGADNVCATLNRSDGFVIVERTFPEMINFTWVHCSPAVIMRSPARYLRKWNLALPTISEIRSDVAP